MRLVLTLDRPRLLSLLAVVPLSLLLGNCAPESSECQVDADCERGSLCQKNGGLVFSGGTCVSRIITPDRDGGTNGGADVGDTDETSPDGAPGGDVSCASSFESACNGKDDDGDGVVDDGCPCDFNGSSDGVCGNAKRLCDGSCPQPTNYQQSEVGGCDGLDNDCDGDTDEGGFKIKDVAAGSNFVCIIDAVDKLRCWGNNRHGQLGDEASKDVTAALTSVRPNSKFERVAAGRWHACAVEIGSGETYCWGKGESGQLGYGMSQASAKPRKVHGPYQFQALAAGDEHTCGIAGSGAIWCWGDNNFGQLATGMTSRSPVPTKVSENNDRYTQIVSGSNHLCALSKVGKVKCWGANGEGQTGTGDTDRVQSSLADIGDSGDMLRFEAIGAGGNHTCAVDTSGNTYCWGANRQGQLGLGMTNPNQPDPQRLAGVPTFEELDAGLAHTCGIDDEDEVHCWGANLHGAVGIGPSASPDKDFTTPVGIQSDTTFRGLSIYDNLSAAESAENEVYLWGQSQGQLFRGSGSGDIRAPKPRRCP